MDGLTLEQLRFAMILVENGNKVQCIDAEHDVDGKLERACITVEGFPGPCTTSRLLVSPSGAWIASDSEVPYIPPSREIGE